MKSFKFVFPLFLVVLLGCSGGKSSQNSGLAALALSGSGGSSNSSPVQVVSLNLSQAFGGKSGLTDVMAVRSRVALSASLTSSSSNILSANTWKRLSDLTSSVRISKGQVLNFAIVPKTGNLTNVNPIEIGTYTGTGKVGVIGFQKSANNDGSGIKLKKDFNPHGVTAVALIARDKAGESNFNFSTLKTESSKLAKATSSNLSAVIGTLDSGIQAFANSISGSIAAMVTAAEGKQGSDAIRLIVLERYADIAYHTYSKAYKDAVNMSNTIQTKLISKAATANDSDINAIKDEWVKARASYLLVEAFRFSNNPIDTKGIFACDDHTTNPPVTSKGECEGYMNAWPLSENTIDAYISGKSSSADITFANILSRNEKDKPAGAAIDTDVKIGWHAIEYLLWGKDTSTTGPGSRPTGDLVGNELLKQKRRKYLSEVTDGLVNHLKALRDQWDKNKTNNFRNKTFISNPKTSVTNIFRGLGKLLSGEIGAERLTLGLNSKNQENEHSCFSDNTKADFFYDIQGILNIWEGKYELKLGTVEPTLIANGGGLKDLVKVSNVSLANQLTNTLIRNRDYFCLNIYPSDPNYTINCTGETKISGRYDQVIADGNVEKTKLRTVERSFILELKTQITKAGQAVGVTITDFAVNLF